jgi:hypothetical protein
MPRRNIKYIHNFKTDMGNKKEDASVARREDGRKQVTRRKGSERNKGKCIVQITE